MNEDFIPYELAVKLKEKGFREDCIAQVKRDNTIKFNYVFDNNIRTILKCHNKLTPYVDAPTISQVLKWLRDKEVYVVPTFCVDQNDNGYWDFRIINLIDGTLVYDEIKNRYNTYELAALAGIEYVIDNLI